MIERDEPGPDIRNPPRGCLLALAICCLLWAALCWWLGGRFGWPQ